MRLLLTLVAAALLLAPVASRQLAVIRVAAGGDLQAAIDAAKPGDSILLAPGAEFVGSFVLPSRDDTGSAIITIRTDGSGLPAAGQRTGPHYSGKLAIIRSDSITPALRTSPRTHHWRIENVEFGPSRIGEREILGLGSDSERQRAEVPHDLVLDRVYLHGDPRRGQKRGIALNSAATEIVNSYIADIKAVGVEGQAIGGWNGPGPYLIENNYLEAAGENVMFGGADPAIPDLIPTGITIRGNHIARPVSWREPLLASPGDVQVEVAAVAEGLVPAATYTYSVVAEQSAAGSPALSAPASAAPLAVPGGAVTVRWTAVPGADNYRVYRAGGGSTVWWRAAAAPFIDRGDEGMPGEPAKRGSVWTVKNLLELKNARQVVIEKNLFENHWPQAQSGYALVFTPRNQNGRAPWCTVEDVRFTSNIVRHVSSAINISGTDDEQTSGRATNIVIDNNLFIDVGGERWGGPGDFVQIGNGPANVRIERNTAIQSGRALFIYGSRHGREVPGFVFRDNVVRYNRYGVFGDVAGIGKAAMAMYFPGGVFEGNVFAGGDAAEYPPGNEFLSADALDEQVVSGPGGYRWKAAGRFGTAGADLNALGTIGQGAAAARPRNKD
jgi:hypothetical protein